jgi:glutamate/tyrosine decarboxylase-like PLP-dependent enzyme
LLPFAIIGTAGSVDRGAFDNLNGLADVAGDLGVWLHIDGAFGAWLAIADDPWRGLVAGIGRADSIACDFHKWMYVQYDCGMVLIRNGDEHRAAFAARPAYLEGQSRGLAGGDPWYCDYGIDLSRGNRGLKVGAALTGYGPGRLGAAITENCRLAALMETMVENAGNMRVCAPVVSNICVFTADCRRGAPEQSEQNKRIAQDLQISGVAVFSTTDVDGITCLRAAITNHRTRDRDIVNAIEAVHSIAKRDG